ncbi:MAG: YqeG family HAD IIIA-type phosphatase [Peptococcaceae bacterium]|nr:YqeG family HAD IIIA-type phosphatase [Peptococcaceae bacterium]
MRLFYPKLYVDSLFDIDLDILHRNNIKGIILDLDNTIMERGANAIPPEVVSWLERLRRNGFELSIVSNSRTREAAKLARKQGIPAIIRAAKPRRRPFKKALAMMGTKPGETAVIGDQIFTDVLGGNRLGMFTILVRPMAGKEFIGTRLITRQLEKVFLPKIRRQFSHERRCSND